MNNFYLLNKRTGAVGAYDFYNYDVALRRADGTVLPLWTGGTPASEEQCQGLERASVWYPEHIEERLRDHYAGIVNRILELQKVR